MPILIDYSNKMTSRRRLTTRRLRTKHGWRWDIRPWSIDTAEIATWGLHTFDAICNLQSAICNLQWSWIMIIRVAVPVILQKDPQSRELSGADIASCSSPRAQWAVKYRWNATSPFFGWTWLCIPVSRKCK